MVLLMQPRSFRAPRPDGPGAFFCRASHLPPPLLLPFPLSLFSSTPRYAFLRRLPPPSLPNAAEVLTYDPVGWGVPYAFSTFGVGDREEALVAASLQALLVLLDYAPVVPVEEEEEEDEGEEEEEDEDEDEEAEGEGESDEHAEGEHDGGDDASSEGHEEGAGAAADGSGSAAAAAPGASHADKVAARRAAASAALSAARDRSASGSGTGSAAGAPAVASSAAGRPKRSSAPQRMAPQFNVFRTLLAGIGSGGVEAAASAAGGAGASSAAPGALATPSAAADFGLIFEGCVRLLGSLPAAEGTLLPGSLKGFTAHGEVLVLLWKSLEENPAFAGHVLASHAVDITRLLMPLTFLLWTGRKDVTKAGQLHLCTFLLLLMSGDREFGVALNRPLTPARLPPLPECPLREGSHADLLVMTLHRLVVDGLPALAPLYPCLLTVISNVSPYIKVRRHA